MTVAGEKSMSGTWGQNAGQLWCNTERGRQTNMKTERERDFMSLSLPLQFQKRVITCVIPSPTIRSIQCKNKPHNMWFHCFQSIIEHTEL